MEDSPLVSPNIKEYCAKFNIENILNEAINEVLTKFPTDPFSLLCGYLKKVRKRIIYIKKYHSTVNQYSK